MITIYTCPIRYGGNQRIKLEFKYDPAIVKSLKQLPDFRWSPLIKVWHISFIENHLEYLNSKFQGRYRFMERISHGPLENLEGILVYYQDVPEEDRIYLKFDINKHVINLIKTQEGSVWHPGIKLWSIKGGKDNFRIMIDTLIRGNCKPIANPVYFPDDGYRKKVNPHKTKSILPLKMINFMVLKNYSPRTIQAYENHVMKFLGSWNPNELENLSDNQISQYILNIVSDNHFSRSYQNQLINAIKLYYRIMQNRNLNTEAVPRPKKERKLPIVLSREEMADLIKSIRNLKHRIIIMTIYGTGIRLSESTNLCIEDIDFHRMLLHIRLGKGKKDRIVPLPEILARELKDYLQSYKPMHYLFEGWKKKQYSPSSVQNILKAALKRAGIVKRASIHSLRHSYASHALEDGTDIRLLQEILGHSNLKTTEIYTHISTTSILRVKSPLDKISL